MQFGKLDIPDQLIEAQERNEFVVFAGAGVSVPAGIPDFKKLVEHTEKNFNEPHIGDDEEPLENRLGKLADNDHDIHKYVFEKFKRYSNHCELHTLLLQLYRDDQKLRLVTTNFDRLFTSASITLGICNLDIFSAPALPPGDRFQGIVHVHGSIATKPEDLVLTDRNFGQAYLTEGWARRFLVKVFSDYSILFYGYKFNDAILKYLSRALPTNLKNKYAFCPEGEEQRWRHLGITPISCPAIDSNLVHELQKKCLQDWVDWTTAGHIWYEKNIKLIVESSSSPDPASSDLLLKAFKSSSTTRLFTRFVDDPDWLSWLDDRKVLDSLFDVQVKLSKSEIELSQWIANRFVITSHNQVLQLIHNHSGIINSTFWHYIIDEVVFHRDQKDRPAPDILAVWVAVLLNNAPGNNVEACRYLGYLLERCEWPGDRYSIIAIFSHLLRPIPVSERDINLFTADEVEFKYAYKIETTGDEYSLNEAWAKFGKHLAEFWRSLLPTIQKYLTDAFEINRAFEKDYDPQSLWRSAIERHEQDKGKHRGFDVLIDIARDILKYLLSQVKLQQEGIALVESWFASEVPLLNRLAINGRAIGNCWSSDEKITWLLENDLIYNRDRNYKHEIFHVIERALPDTSPEVGAKLIDVVLNKKTNYTEGSDEDKLIGDSERYNLLYWMTQKAPKSQEVQSAYDKFSETNPNFRPREYPDFDVWTSGVRLIEPDSPVNAKELEEKSLEDATKLLIEHKGKHQYSDDDDRRGLLDVLTAAVNGNFDWSMQLAKYLIDNDQLKSDIWYHLIKGWGQTPFSVEKWKTVLKFLIVNHKIHRETQSACELLENVVKKEAEISDSLLTNMEHLSDVIWQELEQLPDREPSEINWLAIAINHGSGTLCEFWLQALHKRKQKSGGEWTILPDDYKERFEKVVEGESYAAQLARCVLASRTHYLFFMDKSWVSKKLIPLFNYESSQIAADQAWHGYLVWGQLRTELNELLKPFYIQAINHLTETRDGLRNKLFSNIIDTMLMDTDSKPDTVWFYSALDQEGTTDEDRQEVLTRLWAILREADDGFKNSLWARWFKDYWTDRLSNKPVALSTSESNKMLELLPWLAPVFDEAVVLALKIRNFEFQYTHLYSDFCESKLVSSHPKEITKLLVHLLSKSGESTNQGRYLVTLYEKLSKELNDSELLELKNILVRLGVISAI